MNTKFACLDPRKRKKKTIHSVLESLGEIYYFRLPFMDLRGYPESKSRAQIAFKQAIHPFQNQVLALAQRKLYEWQYNGSRRFFSLHPETVAVAWNGLNGSRLVFMAAARDARAKTLFFEEAPLPNRVSIDVTGLNFSNSLPRSIAPYIAWMTESHVARSTWRQAGENIIQRPPMKSAQAFNNSAPPLTEPYLFVPLQVPNDSQLRIYGGAFNTVDLFVEAILEAAKNLPPGWHVRIKEHPSAKQSIAHDFLSVIDVPVYLDNTTDTFEQVAASKGVLTVNSSVGLVAMFYDKPVIAAGKCFWAIEGVAIAAPTKVALAQVMAKPDQLTFDVQARNAFMNFLTEVYYPELKTGDDGALLCSAEEADKVSLRLQGPDQFGFWKQQGSH